MTPPAGSCADCFATAFVGLTTAQIQAVLQGLGGTGTSIPSICNSGGTFTAIEIAAAFTGIGDLERIQALIQCLTALGLIVPVGG